MAERSDFNRKRESRTCRQWPSVLHVNSVSGTNQMIKVSGSLPSPAQSFDSSTMTMNLSAMTSTYRQGSPIISSSNQLRQRPALS
eukprot:scaffold7214_cov410-Prasinococcus_capsulatus_cf.AAC.17